MRRAGLTVSPEPYVRGQAAALFTILLCACLVAPPLCVAISVLLVGILVGSLDLKYRRDLRLSGSSVPEHRSRLDSIVLGDARLGLTVSLVVSGVVAVAGVEMGYLNLPPITPILIIAAVATVYLSSLVDWFVILPRVSGQLGPRPCRPESGHFVTFPKTWREVTRWWYVHRIVAALVLRFGLSYAVVFTLHQFAPFPVGAGFVGGALVGSLASYLAAVPRAAWEAGHPTAIVGRTVRRRATGRQPPLVFGVGSVTFQIPSFRRQPVGEPGPREYVFDVALECAEVVSAAPRESLAPEAAITFEKDPAKLALVDIRGCDPAEPAFSGCANRCSGISWYCIENPQCFEPK